MANTILITDYAWPDLSIERQAIEGAGFRLAAGPSAPLPAEQITALAREHQPGSILTCWARVDAAAIQASANLRHVGRIGVGLDNIDVDACTARGVAVTNVPDYCVEEVSDHALAFTLAWARGIVTFDRAVHAGLWDPALARLRRVRQLVVGIIGLGRIGQATARKFSGLGCRVLAHTRTAPTRDTGAVPVALDTLLAQSDVVIVNVPLTPATRGLFDANRIAAMKPGALLVNVSRGPLVDTGAVIDALQRGHLGGAALDVLDTEPQVPPELLAQPGAVLTPHVAFSSDASLIELRQRAAEEAVRVLRGQAPQHPCNTLSI